ncbi:ribbon-helix-helix protein, CopG family [Scytonema sp. PCC 10023]
MVKLSKRKERSMNELIREAVRQYIEKETHS